VGEIPYAEGVGDKADLTLPDKDVEIIENVQQHSKELVVIIISGQPMVITNHYQYADAWVAARLPGSEGQGIADVLFRDYPFRGTLPFSWPRDMNQLPFDFEDLPTQWCQSPLFPMGYGLNVSTNSAPDLLDCE
jgi:beta-glucosidase